MIIHVTEVNEVVYGDGLAGTTEAQLPWIACTVCVCVCVCDGVCVVCVFVCVCT